MYWKHRRKLFGPTRAFLPMTLEGAMEEVGGAGCLQKGLLNILPKDKCGRAVIFFDRIRAIPTVATREVALQIIFYMLQKSLSEDEQVQEKGFVFIENISGYDLYTHFDRIFSKTQMALLREAFPSQLKAYHIWGGTSGGWAIDLICPVIKQLAGKEIRLRMICHTGHESFRTFCTTYNFNPDDLSIIIGGSYTYANHVRWIQRVMAQEQQEEQKDPNGNRWCEDQHSRSIGSFSILPPPSLTSSIFSLLSHSSAATWTSGSSVASADNPSDLSPQSMPRRSGSVSSERNKSTASRGNSFHTSRSYSASSTSRAA